MLRALPYSLVIHAALLGALAYLGSTAAQPVIAPQRTIHVRLAQLPQREPPAAVQQQPPPAETTPARRPQPEPAVLPPKQKPEPKPEPPRPRPQSEPQPRLVQPDPDPALEPQVESLSALLPAASSTALAGTDRPLPAELSWYLNLVEGRVSREWEPHQLGFRDSNRRSCVVHFFVERDGSVTRATTVQSSGVALFDREALRAVQAAHPLPQLPPRYTHRNLGVTFVFTLESGF